MICYYGCDGKESYCVQTGLAFLNNILSIKLRSSCWEESCNYFIYPVPITASHRCHNVHLCKQFLAGSTCYKKKRYRPLFTALLEHNNYCTMYKNKTSSAVRQSTATNWTADNSIRKMHLARTFWVQNIVNIWTILPVFQYFTLWVKYSGTAAVFGHYFASLCFTR